MPKIINPVYATVTTHRSNSPSAFFDISTDAIPQDCKEITGRLLGQAQAILKGVDLDLDIGITEIQLQAIDNLLSLAFAAHEKIDIEQAVLMAQREEV